MSKPEITKRILAEGLISLMEKQPLAKIGIGDIAEECQLNRNTFYYHFKDKFDLVNWIFYSWLAKEVSDEQNADISTWQFIEHICVHFYENQAFYINALSVSGQNCFSEYCVELLCSLINTSGDDIPAFDTENDYGEYFDKCFITALVNTIFIWVKDDAKIPPDQFVMSLKQATEGAANRLLNISKSS